MSEVVALGETMALVASSPFGRLRHARELTLGVGGAESNLTIGVARLGRSASWIGRVGDDELGVLVVNTLRSEGVDVRAVVDHNAPTGLMLKECRAPGAARISYYRRGSAGSRLAPGDVDRNVISAAHVLHVTGITLALSKSARAAVDRAIELARAAGALISLDVNYRTGLWTEAEAAATLRPLLHRCDVVFAGSSEARLLVDADSPIEQARAIAALGVRFTLVKLGAEGAVASLDGTMHACRAPLVTEVDPVGAGDGFAAGFLAALCASADPVEALDMATRAGALAVTSPGDWEGLPTLRELRAGPAPQDNVVR